MDNLTAKPISTIFLQTALSHTFVALYANNTCIDQVQTCLDFKSDNIYVADMGTLLSRNLLKPPDLKRISVLTGPGYFTGIRAGLVIAKALCDSLALEVGLVDSFDYLRAGMPLSGNCAIVIAASRKEGYLAYFKGQKKVSEEMIALTRIEEIQKKEKVYSETPFIQEIYAVEPITAKPILPTEVTVVSRSEEICPHYIRGEADLFKASSIK
jgi:tRNA threonylcarbamoyl adenosine modification protein YeaZ